MEIEQWRPIVGFEGNYEISNLGQVKSLHKRHCNKTISILHRDGFPCVQLSKEGRNGYYKLHRLLAEAFIPNPFQKTSVIFLDGDRTNLSLDNIAWADTSEICRLRRSKENWAYVVDMIKQSTDKAIPTILQSLNEEFEISRQ